MSKRDNYLLLQDICEACDKIEAYTSEMSFNEFLSDDKTKDAVIRNFEIIGEAANRLSEKVLLQNLSLNKQQIIGLRNRLIHAYFGVDYQILWNIIKHNLPVLKQEIERLVKRQDG